VTNNTVSDFGGVLIFVGQVAGNATAASSLVAVISNNTLSHPTSATNHALIAFLTSSVGQVSTANILIDNNSISEPSTVGTPRPILVDTPDANTTPSFTARVINNTVTNVDPTFGTSADVTVRRGAACFDVRNNSVSGPFGIRVRQSMPDAASTAQLERGVSAANDAATVLDDNHPVGTVTSVLGTITVVNNGACLAAPP
jgi:hypothetical protein